MTVNGQHKHKKALTSVLLAAVIFAGGYYVYDQGFLPGAGNGKKSAERLKAKIETLEGENIENNLVDFLSGNDVISRIYGLQGDRKKASLKEKFEKDIDVIFTYAQLETTTEHGNGVVKVVSPKISVVSTGKEGRDYDITIPALYIAQDDKDSGHYLYRVEGDIDVQTDVNGERVKLFVLKYGSIKAEMKLNNERAEYSKISGNDLQLTEGRSGTMLVSADAFNSETTQKIEGEKLVSHTKSSYSNIAPGEMIKLFIKNIEPVDIDLDYISEEPLIESTDKMALSADLKINDLSVKMAGAGLESNAHLKYNPVNDNIAPQGDVYAKFAQYHKVLTILQKYYPVKPEEMRSVANFLMEIGADEGEDASFDLKFDAKGKMLINGKTEAEFKKIYERNFPHRSEEVSPVEKIPTIEKKKL